MKYEIYKDYYINEKTEEPMIEYAREASYLEEDEYL